MGLVDIIVSRMHLSENREKIMRNLFWSVLGKVVTMLGSLFVGIVVARYLGPKDYGIMSYVIGYVFLFQVLASFGLDSIEVREMARGEVPFQQVLGTAFVLKLVLAVLTILLCLLTSWQMEADSYTTLVVAIYSCSIIAQSFNVIRNYFLAMVRNEHVVKSEIGRTLLGACVKLALLYFHSSLTWFVVASMFDWVLLSGGYITSYRSQVGRIRDWHFDSRYARYLLGQSYPLLLTNAAVVIYQRIDQVMIGQMIDKENVGYFSTAARFVEVLIYIPMMLAQTISPVLVRARQASEADYRRKAQQFMNISLWCSILASLVTALLAYWIVLFTFGEAYLPAVGVLQVLAFKAASVALSNTAGNMLVIEGLQRWAFCRDSLGCIACVVLNYLLLPRYGIMAAAVVAIVTNVVAGYLADALVPSFRHLFVAQTRALLFGWTDLIHIHYIIKGRRATS